MNPPNAISTAKAISIANAQGQRIYHITRENIDEVLPNINQECSVIDNIRNSIFAGSEVIIHLDPAVRSEISTALFNGMEVTVHETPVNVFGWTGTGYIIIDPETGSGAYKISGGANGGFFDIIGFLDTYISPLYGFGAAVLENGVLGSAGGLASLVNGLFAVGFIYSVLNASINCERSAVPAIIILTLFSLLAIFIVFAFFATPFIAFFVSFAINSFGTNLIRNSSGCS